MQYQDWFPENSQPFSKDLPLSVEKDVYFFCDLHADAQAFLNSLKLSGLITQQSSTGRLILTENAQQSQIIIGGDCFDKGPSNLELFQLLTNLRQTGVDLVLLAGNHDIRVLAGLIALDHQKDIRQSHFVVRMGRKTVSLFKEIFDQYKLATQVPTLTNAEAIAALSPNASWYTEFKDYADIVLTEKQLKKELKQIHKKQIDLFDACLEVGLEPKQLHQTIKFAQRLFIDPNGEFAWFFKELKLLHRSGNYLFCHAGLDDSIAQQLAQTDHSADKLNRRFEHALRTGKIFQIYYSSMGNVVRTKYRDNDFPFTQQGADNLRKTGIYAIVNGHRSHLDGQKIYLRQGILNFECDTELNSNCRQKHGLTSKGESVTIFNTDGMVSALCSDLPQPKQFRSQQQTA